MDDIEMLLLRRKLAGHEFRFYCFRLNMEMTKDKATREAYERLAENELSASRYVRLELEARYRMKIGVATQGNGHDDMAEEREIS